MTKLPMSWKEGHTVASHSSICTFRISSQCFLHFTFPTHSQHHLVCTFEASLFPFTICYSAGKSQSSLASLLHHSQHSHLPCHSYLRLPFVLSCLLIFLVQATLSVQPTLGHSPPDQGSHLASISLLPSLFSVQNVAGKTLFLSNHLAYLVATWPLLHLLPLPIVFKLFDSQFFKARGDPCA